MLYNRNAVKNLVPISKERRNLARANPFFRLPGELGREIRAVVDIGRNDLETVLDVTDKFGSAIEYDYSHTYQGIRTATEVLADRKGNCIEQNAFLYAALKALKINSRFTVLKNPKGYVNGIDDLGFHAVLRFKCDGKRYLADLGCSGVVEDNKEFKYVMRQDMTLNEFVSFYLMDGGEDMLIHGNPKEALEFFNCAFAVDPNNYPLYFAAAEARLQQGKLRKAEENCKEGIKMAPDIADVYVGYGEILLQAEVSKNRVIKQYKKAVFKETEDIQVLTLLSRRLGKLGEKKLRKEVLEKLNERRGGLSPEEWSVNSGTWHKKG